MIRGILGGLSVSTSFLAVTYLNLSVATVIASTSPILTGILQCSSSIYHWIGMLFCFCGVVLIILFNNGTLTTIIDLSENKNLWVGVSFAMVGSLLTAMVNVTIHEIRDEKALTITLYSMGVCGFLAIPGMIVTATRTTHAELENLVTNLQNTSLATRLALIGIINVLAQYLKTCSIKASDNRIELGVIVNVRYLEVIFCIMWDVFILHSQLSSIEIVGIFLVLLGCCFHYCLSLRRPNQNPVSSPLPTSPNNL